MCSFRRRRGGVPLLLSGALMISSLSLVIFGLEDITISLNMLRLLVVIAYSRVPRLATASQVVQLSEKTYSLTVWSVSRTLNHIGIPCRIVYERFLPSVFH